MSDMSLDNLISSAEDNFEAFDTSSFVDFGFLDDSETPEQKQKRKAECYKKIAKRHDTGKVIIGDVVETRENYVENRLIVIVEAPIKSNDFKGVEKAEGWIEASNAEGLTMLSNNFWVGRFVVIDQTHKIIEAC